MKILTRYVLREFVIPLTYCLVGFISIYVLFDLFGQFSKLISSDAPVGLCVLSFCGYLAPFFHYLAPAALMLAAIYTMWNFCRHSELIAMRANGIGFLAIVKPILGVALVMTAFVFWVNEWYVPCQAQWANRFRAAHFNLSEMARADNIVFRNAKQGRTWTVDGLLTADGTSLQGVRLTIDRPGGFRLKSITAERADYLDGEWWFSGTKVQNYDSTGREVASTTPELDALPFRNFPFLKERPSDFLLQNREWAYNSIVDKWRYLRLHPGVSDKMRRRYTYDIWAQMMAPFACLIITLFAIPAGIASGRQSVFKGILGALVLYFAYYGCVIGCMACADVGVLPAVPAALIPLVLFFGIGLYLFHRHR